MVNLKNYSQKINAAKYVVVICMALTLMIAWLQKPNAENVLQQLTQRLDFLLYDLRFTAFPLKQAQTSPQVVIIDIDERSLREVGRFPWSRKIIAQLVGQLHHAQVATVAFDVMFTESEDNIALTVAKEIKNKSISAQLKKMAEAFDYDQLMANTITGRDVVLGYALQDEALTASTLPTSTIDLESFAVAQTFIEPMPGYTANIPLLQTAATGNGFINGNPDIDGSVRRAPLVMRYGDQLYASLALQTALNYLLIDKIKPEVLQDQNGNIHLQGFNLSDSQRVRTDSKGRLLVPYRGPQKTFPYFSAADVLQGTVNAEQLAGKIAIIGTSAVGLKDLRTTPVGINYPGVEVQANVIDALLNGMAPYQPDWAIAANIVLILLTGFCFCLVMPACGPLLMTLLGLGGLLTISALNVWLWQYHAIDLPASGPLLTIALIYGVNLSYGFFTTSHQKTQIKSMFGQYVAPAHIDRLLSDSSALSFAGETKEMTVLFSDVRNFTTTSEKLSATQLKDMLNRYFTPMTEIIFDQHGTIDKYVGDLIMAFWGAPLPDENQKAHAVQTALLMLKQLEKIWLEFKPLNYPEIHIGIGINTGTMNVGDMGSTYRRAYTVLGDAVNLGSRLESITKFYGVACLVSESTKSGLENQFLFREIDYIQVKGKKEPVRVYQPIAQLNQATPEMIHLAQAYEQARALYLNQNWQGAIGAFYQLITQDKVSEKLYRLYIERATNYNTNPPSAEWIGVWKHDEK